MHEEVLNDPSLREFRGVLPSAGKLRTGNVRNREWAQKDDSVAYADLLKAHPQQTQAGLSAALGISRQAILKHIANLKGAGRLRRIGRALGGC